MNKDNKKAKVILNIIILIFITSFFYFGSKISFKVVISNNIVNRNHNYGNNKEDKILKKLSTEEKIGQLFLIGFEGTKLTPEIKELFNVIHPGGVILFSRNIRNENQLKKLISNLQSLSIKKTGLPLFVAIDQEGGIIRRIKWINDEMSQSEIKNSHQAYKISLYRGEMLKSLGINLNLSPILDMTKKGDFIYNRSFQKNIREIEELGNAMVLGQKDSGILTAIKHFPGYGGISFNPEKVRIPILKKIPEISQFQEVAKKTNPEFIMVANVIYRGINNELPFALSREGINFTKREINGNYIIISDDLSSDVLKGKFPLWSQIVLAKKAGVDMLLVAGHNKSQYEQLVSFNVLLRAVQNNKISKKQIDDSVLKIIRLKERLLVSQ